MPINFEEKLADIFIGRQTEFETLTQLLSQAKNGRGNFVVLNGEEGVGKSRLVEYFVQNQNQADIIHVTESFKDLKPHEPYAPFVRIIKKLSGKEAELSIFNPEVEKDAISIDGGFNPENLYSLQARHNLVKQHLLSSVLSLSKNQALVIFLNHAHLAPLTSWKFIHYLSESIHASNILLITTIRQNGHEQAKENVPVYANVLQRMNREGIVTKIQLNRFSEKELRNYLHQVFTSKDFSTRFQELLFEVSNGIPQHICTLLSKLLKNEAIYQYNGVWVDREGLTRDDFLALIGSTRISERALQKYENLSDRQKELLLLISLLDEPFHHRFVLAFSDLNRIKVLKELLTFHELKILHQLTDETYKFKSTVLKKQISSGLSESDKEQKHLYIAEHVEADGSIEYSDKVFCLAYHFYLGGSRNKAFKYLRAASEMAIENFAFQEALDLINNALDTTNDVEGTESKGEIAQLLIWASWLERILGNLDNSIKRCEMAISMLPGDQYGMVKSQALIQLGFSYFRLTKWNKALWCFNECLRQHQTMGQLDHAMAKYGLGNVYFELAEYEKATKFFESALLIAQKMQASQLMANVFNNLGALENIRNQKMRAIALYSKSIPIFKKLGDDFGLARVYHNIGITHADDNNWQQANEFFGQSLLVSDMMGLVPLKSITFLNRAYALANLDNLEEAREYNVKAYRLLVSLKDELGLAEYHKVQGIIEFKESSFDTARANFEKAIVKFRLLKNKLGLAETVYEFALMELKLGNASAALENFENSLSNYKELNLNDKVHLIERKIVEIKNSGQQSQPPTERTEVIQ